MSSQNSKMDLEGMIDLKNMSEIRIFKEMDANASYLYSREQWIRANLDLSKVWLQKAVQLSTEVNN